MLRDIAEVRRTLVASPAYPAARGEPRSPEELEAHDLIAFDNFAPNGEWRFGADLKRVVRFEPRLMTNSVEAAIDAAIGGAGVARTLNYQTDADVAAGRLRYVLPEFEPGRPRSTSSIRPIACARRTFALFSTKRSAP